MKNKLLRIFTFLLPLIISLSSCSDFRKAVGKEKVIPDEFSLVMTPSIIIPPGFKIDPEIIQNSKSNEIKSTNINVLLNRVKQDQKNESRKKILFTAATSLGLVLFGVLVF